MFCESKDIKLINLVKSNPILYDTNDPKYMDYDLREVVWQKIGDELQRPANKCKSRWVHIRDVNRRKLKRSIKFPTEKSKHYKYQTHLSFMRPYYKDVLAEAGSEDFSDHVNTSTNDKDDDDSDSDLATVQRKSKQVCPNDRNDNSNSKPDTSSAVTEVTSALDPSDPLDSFLLSIGATLRRLSPYHLNIVKSKIFNMVQEEELQQIKEQQNR